MEIVPAILTDRLELLQSTLKMAEAFTDYVQIDFMDGVFVPSRSVSPRDMRDTSTSLVCEAHLMVEEPEIYLEDLKRFGFRRVIFHHEADSDARRLIDRIHLEGMQPGIALNPETNTSCVDDLVSEINSVLFLSVNPGFYGSPFIPSVLDKIVEFRGRHPSAVIGLDGGVAVDNVSEISSLGVDYACVGSRIFMSDDPAGSYREFQKKAGR
jgi:ribulose-phosphate 3-epimerase